MQSATLFRDPATYSLLPDFVPDAEGTFGIEVWRGTYYTDPYPEVKQPIVGINATGAPFWPSSGVFAWPPNAILLHPAPSQMAIVGWRSPLSGTVLISGTVIDLDPNGGDGIEWYIERGTASLLARNLPNGGADPFDLAAVTVAPDEFIYFIVHPKGNYHFDSTQLDLTIERDDGRIHSISGEVRGSSGNPVPGVVVVGGAGGHAVTDATGAYAFQELLEGTYTITPTKTGYKFTPSSRTITVPPDAVDQDFVAAPATYSVSGHIIDDTGNPVPAVTIAAGPYSAVTDATGNYTLPDLPAGTYTLVPSSADYNFVPPTRTVTLPPDAVGQSFVAHAVPKDPAWTFIYFLPADSDLDAPMASEYAGIPHGTENPQTNVVCFYDGFATEARYVSFTPAGAAVLHWQGELNTGEPSTLSDFVHWAKTNYPAQHYALVISGHGHALGGTASDAHPADLLTPRELRQALQDSGGLDVLYMSNSLMANLEMEYELRGTADYYVASESFSWKPTSHASYIVGVDDSTTPEQLAYSMAESYSQDHLSGDGQTNPSTISAVRLSDVEMVATATSELAGAIRQHWTSMAVYAWALTEASVLQRFDENLDLMITNSDRLADLHHFAQLVAQLPEPDVQDAANSLLGSLDDYTVYNDARSGLVRYRGQSGFWDHTDAMGISVAVPRDRMSFYTFEWLDFAQGANWTLGMTGSGKSTADNGVEWGPLLVSLVGQFNPDAPGTSEPPDPGPFLVSGWKMYLPIVLRQY
ncbi:clostripain-related cysteine peptidase [Chloroflexota bacterium]